MSTTHPPINIKNIDWKNVYFPKFKALDIKYDELKMSDMALYSSTQPNEVKQINKVIHNFYKNTLECKYDDLPVVTDANACVGCSTIGCYFDKNYSRVNSVEYDKNTFDILINNLKHYRIDCSNVYFGDYNKLYDTIDQDVVLLDPPWGGPKYHAFDKMELYVGERNIVDICANLLDSEMASLVVIKVPKNYNIKALTQTSPDTNQMIQEIYRGTHHSYNVVYRWN